MAIISLDNNCEKILIIDDNEQNREIIKTFLLEEGYQVLTAQNGEDGLEFVENEDIDLVLLDILMPGINGFEVCRKIKFEQDREELPVIMITSLEAREDRLKGLEAGADDFLAKPVDWAELMGRVRSLLRLKKAHDRVEDQYIKLENQLKMARGVQKALAKVNIPSQIKGEVFYNPVDKVGGDVYDLFPLSENKYGIFFGDSSGHGVPAALVMVIVKLLCRNIDKNNLTPAEFLNTLNNELVDHFEDGLKHFFVTAVYLTVDTKKRQIYWSNGGHPCPLLIYSTEKWSRLESTSLPLGIVKDTDYNNQKLEYENKASLFFYTDGLIDFYDPGKSKLSDKLVTKFISKLNVIDDNDKSVFYNSLKQKLTRGYNDDISYGFFTFK